MQANHYLTSEAGRADVNAVLADCLAKHLPPLPPNARQQLPERTWAALNNIADKATRQNVSWPALARQLASEQALIWWITQGEPAAREQALRQLMQKHTAAVQHFLRGQFQFKHSDIIDEINRDTFKAFYSHLTEKRRPVLCQIDTLLIAMARHKALHQLRYERSAGRDQIDSLETVFVHIDSPEAGTFDYPLPNDPDESYTLPATPRQPKLTVAMDRLKEWLADCFKTLSPSRQTLIRLRFKYLPPDEQTRMSIEDLETIDAGNTMARIAQEAGYTDAHTASVRLRESLNRLRTCLDSKRQRPR